MNAQDIPIADAERTREVVAIVTDMILARRGPTGNTIEHRGLTLRFFDQPGAPHTVHLESLSGEHLIITNVSIPGWRVRSSYGEPWTPPPADAAAVVTVMRGTPQQWRADVQPNATHH